MKYQEAIDQIKNNLAQQPEDNDNVLWVGPFVVFGIGKNTQKFIGNSLAVTSIGDKESDEDTRVMFLGYNAPRPGSITPSRIIKDKKTGWFVVESANDNSPSYGFRKLELTDADWIMGKPTNSITELISYISENDIG